MDIEVLNIGRAKHTLTLAIVLFALTLSVTVLGIALAMRKLSSPKTAHPVTTAWIEELSLERYRPMMNLLDEADFQFLRTQGSSDGIRMDEFRRGRIRAFRQYLKRLNADFASVCMALKIVMLQSEADRPELGKTLLRAQTRFALGMVTVQVRLAFYEIGIGRVEADGLLSLFDNVRLQLQQMLPESAVWGS